MKNAKRNYFKWYRRREITYKKIILKEILTQNKTQIDERRKSN
jgi:hypothetical protein